MKFYNREEELRLLQKGDALKKEQAIMSIVIGQRRVGKTA